MVTSRKWDGFTARNSVPDILVSVCCYKSWILPRSHDLLGSLFGCQYMVWIEYDSKECTYTQCKGKGAARSESWKALRITVVLYFFKGWFVVLILFFHHIILWCVFFLFFPLSFFLVPWPGIKLTSSAEEVQSLNHWPTGYVLQCTLFLQNVLMHYWSPLLFPKQAFVSAFPFPTNGNFDAIMLILLGLHWTTWWPLTTLDFLILMEIKCNEKFSSFHCILPRGEY